MSQDLALKHVQVQDTKDLFNFHLTRLTLGAIASICGQLVVHPIEIAKIKMQLSFELGSKTQEYTSIFKTCQILIRDWGITSLYKGNQASVVREVIYSGIRLGVYEPIKGQLGCNSGEYVPLHLKLLSGSVAGIISSSISTPLDLIKVRAMNVEGKQLSIFQHCNNIHELGGIKGFWKGVYPTVIRSAIINGTQLGFYDYIKHYLIRHKWIEDGMYCHFVASFITGIFCAVTSSPIDLAKTRIMADSTSKYKGISDCLKKTYKHEGILGWYKGFNAQWLRIGPTSIVQFIVWEKLRELYGIDGI